MENTLGLREMVSRLEAEHKRGNPFIPTELLDESTRRSTDPLYTRRERFLRKMESFVDNAILSLPDRLLENLFTYSVNHEGKERKLLNLPIGPFDHPIELKLAIDALGLKRPSSALVASMIYDVHCQNRPSHTGNKPEKKLGTTRWTTLDSGLIEGTRLVITKEGVYGFNNSESKMAKDSRGKVIESDNLPLKDIQDRFNAGSYKQEGVLFNENGDTWFIERGLDGFVLGLQDMSTFAKNPYLFARYGPEGSEKIVKSAKELGKRLKEGNRLPFISLPIDPKTLFKDREAYDKLTEVRCDAVVRHDVYNPLLIGGRYDFENWEGGRIRQSWGNIDLTTEPDKVELDMLERVRRENAERKGLSGEVDRGFIDLDLVKRALNRHGGIIRSCSSAYSYGEIPAGKFPISEVAKRVAKYHNYLLALSDLKYKDIISTLRVTATPRS